MKYLGSLVIILLVFAATSCTKSTPVAGVRQNAVFNEVGIADGTVLAGNYIYALSQEADSDGHVHIIKLLKSDFTSVINYADVAVKGGRGICVAGGYLWTAESSSAEGAGTRLCKRDLTTLETLDSCEPLLGNGAGHSYIDSICSDGTSIYCFGRTYEMPYVVARINIRTKAITTVSHASSTNTSWVHACIVDTVGGYIYISIMPNGPHPGVYQKLNISDLAIVASVEDRGGNSVFSHDDALQDSNYVYFNGGDGHLKRFAKSDMSQTDLPLSSNGLIDGMCFLNGSGNQGQNDGRGASGYLITQQGGQMTRREVYVIDLASFTLKATYHFTDATERQSNEIFSDGAYLYVLSFGGYPDRWIELKTYNVSDNTPQPR